MRGAEWGNQGTVEDSGPPAGSPPAGRMEGDDATAELPSGIREGQRVPWAAWREVGCAVNPPRAQSTEDRAQGPARRVLAGLGAALCQQSSLTAASDGNRTDLTLPRGCRAPGGLA